MVLASQPPLARNELRIVGPTSKWTAFREHQKQAALWRAITLPVGAGGSRFIVCEAPRRSGKTELFKRGGVRVGWGNTKWDDYLVVFAAPTRDQAKEIYWDHINALIPPQLVRKRSESKLFVRLHSGTTYQVVGMDKPQRIEGKPVDWIGCDEFAEWKPGSYDKIVRPLLATPGRPGRACFYGVPRPSSQFKAMSEIARDPANAHEWAYFWWDSEGLLDEAEIASARSTMDPRTFEQEMRGLRVAFAGRAYYTFERALHAEDRTEYDPRLPLVFCFDFNVDPGVAIALQEKREYRGPRKDIAQHHTEVLGEVHIPQDSNTPAVCRKLIADWAGRHRGPVYCYGDRNGGNRQTSQTEGPDWRIIEDMLGGVDGWRVSLLLKSANPSERERVNAMCSRLRATDGTVRLLVPLAQAPRLVDDLEMVTVKKGTDGELDKKRDLSLTHPSDALGYEVEYEHGGAMATSRGTF